MLYFFALLELLTYLTFIQQSTMLSHSRCPQNPHRRSQKASSPSSRRLRRRSCEELAPRIRMQSPGKVGGPQRARERQNPRYRRCRTSAVVESDHACFVVDKAGPAGATPPLYTMAVRPTRVAEPLPNMVST